MRNEPSVAKQTTWQFGDYPEDGDVWLAVPELTIAYVDFQLRGMPVNQWRRVTVVTHSWVRRQLEEGRSGAASWPSLLVVPDGSPAQIRAWITDLIESGGAVLEDNSAILPAGWRPATGPRPADEY